MVNPNAFHISLPCPNCRQTDMQLIGELVGNDQIACRICGGPIDLTNEEWQARLLEMIKGLREITIEARE